MINKVVDYINSLMDEIYYSEIDNINAGASIISKQLNLGGKLVFFGQGHSVFVGKDVEGLYDIPILALKEEENMDNLLTHVKQEDILIITSNSGINEYVIEFARRVKEKGNKIIVLTSYKHTFNVPSRHHSLKKLYEYGDVVIDNCCVLGDAAIKDNNNYVGSYSSLANSAIVHTMINICLKKL